MKKKAIVYPETIRRLRVAGCPMPQDCEDDPVRGFSIIVSKPERTKAYVQRGWVEYVFAVSITNNSYGPLEIRKFECRLPWCEGLIWPRPRPIDLPAKPSYRLPQSGKEFVYETVLNHRTGRAGMVNPGETVDGVLLAFRKCQGVPDDGLAGPVIPADLSIMDQSGQEHFSEIEITVDCTAIIDSLKLKSRPARGLFDTFESEPRTPAQDQARRYLAGTTSKDIADKPAIPQPPKMPHVDTGGPNPSE
jgi:hypothetical protein